MQRFTQNEMHVRLMEKNLSETYRTGGWTLTQALNCPYYVPVSGRLGSDWGIILNPESNRFGLLTFEHDDCGCPGDENRHREDPAQEADLWLAETTVRRVVPSTVS